MTGSANSSTRTSDAAASPASVLGRLSYDRRNPGHLVPVAGFVVSRERYRGGLMDSVSEVVVAGAGPTGLMLAGDLARAGVDCTVLERRAEESNLTRAFAVHARTLEILDARGLADDLVTSGARVGALRVFGKLEVDLCQLPTRFPYVLVTPQYHTERVLEEHASALGAQIVRGAEVVGLRQDNDGVELDVRYEDGTLGTQRTMYA